MNPQKEITGEIQIFYTGNIHEKLFEMVIENLYQIYCHNKYEEGILWLLDLSILYWTNIETIKYTWKNK
jgi:hypothetical protein